jgi:hypothetical protein
MGRLCRADPEVVERPRHRWPPHRVREEEHVATAAGTRHLSCHCPCPHGHVEAMFDVGCRNTLGQRLFRAPATVKNPGEFDEISPQETPV